MMPSCQHTFGVSAMLQKLKWKSIQQLQVCTVQFGVDYFSILSKNSFCDISIPIAAIMTWPGLK